MYTDARYCIRFATLGQIGSRSGESVYLRCYNDPTVPLGRNGDFSLICIASEWPTIHAGSNAFRKRHQEELLDKIHARGTVQAKAHCASDKALTRAPHVCACTCRDRTAHHDVAAKDLMPSPSLRIYSNPALDWQNAI